jgi:hypothetical protein
MDRAQITHYIRIAVTALSLTACVLLIALWVRSYWWAESGVSVPPTLPRQFAFVSSRGRLALIVSQRNPRSRVDFYFPWRWRIESDSLKRVSRPAAPPRPMWVYKVNKNMGRLIVIPHWSPVLLFGAIATCLWLPWFKWRFGLRTLLIATTLVAVGLGVVVVLS